MKQNRTLITLAIATLTMAMATTAQAGTFTQLKVYDNAEAWLFEGEIVEGDAKAFANLLARDPHIILVIDSPGGSALEGFALGRLTMKYRDEVTLVAQRAYSAAGMWWLGDDEPQFLDDKSEVGWHLSYLFGERMDESSAQLLGHLTGKYLSDALDEDTAEALMIDLATIQAEYGKFALRTLRKDGKLRIKK